jgi:taurine dioxygenase
MLKFRYRDIAAVRAIVMAGNSFKVRRLSGSIGAEILGIDLASEPADNAIGEIRQVWLEHNVIFFRDQDLPPAKFLAFAKRFGEVVEYPFIKGIEGFPEIIPVIKLRARDKEFRRKSGTPTLPISRYRQWGPC